LISLFVQYVCISEVNNSTGENVLLISFVYTGDVFVCQSKWRRTDLFSCFC